MMKMIFSFLLIKRELVLQRTDVTQRLRDWVRRELTDSL